MRVHDKLEEFYAYQKGLIDGREDRQRDNTTALKKVLQTSGVDIEGAENFGQLLYVLKRHLINEKKDK